MTCSDLKELLSAYADGELAETQRDFVEGHLRDCGDCQATLADYRQVGQRVSSLRATGIQPEIEEGTMSRIRRDRVFEGSRRWLRPVLVAAPVAVVAVAVLLLSLSGAFQSVASVFAEAHAAAGELASYRLTGVSYSVWLDSGEREKTTTAEAEFVAPGSSHIIRRTNYESPLEYERTLERIVVDGRGFTTSPLALKRGPPELPGLMGVWV